MRDSTHRVVIVGGGFGGDRTNHHTFQPLLYQLATGVLSEGAVEPPLRQLLRKPRNVRVELADVKDVDLQAAR